MAAGDVEAVLCGPQAGAGDVDPAPVEPGHGDVEAGALLPDHVVQGHLAVLQDDGPRGLAVPAHLLLLLAETQALQVRLLELLYGWLLVTGETLIRSLKPAKRAL